MTYRAIHKPNQLIYGTGDSQTIIVTGWTPKELVAKHCNPDHYAAIGQLYNATRGINYLVRNLLANPQIRLVVTLGCTKEDTNAGAVRCLMDFKRYGVREGVDDTGSPAWVISSPVVGYIDHTIPLADLELLRNHVGWFEGCSVRGTVDLANLMANRGGLEPWGEPREYPMTLQRSSTNPASLYGHRIEAHTIAQCWLSILHRIRTNGLLRPTVHDGQVQELIDLVAVVTMEPQGLYFPHPNYLPFERSLIEGSYLAHFMEDGNHDKGVQYSYGQRIRSHFGVDQVKTVIQKLLTDPHNGRAVINLWDATVDNDSSSSPPCLNHVWVRIIAGELTLTATLRSNDMFSAWPANAMALRTLQDYIREQVDPTLTLGPLVTISQSAHLYDDTFKAADRVLADHYKGHRVTYEDPIGNFIIERYTGQVVVTQTAPNGTTVGQFKGTRPLPLSRKVIAANPSIQPLHAAYLGIEVQRAFASPTYTQDQP